MRPNLSSCPAPPTPLHSPASLTHSLSLHRPSDCHTLLPPPPLSLTFPTCFIRFPASLLRLHLNITVYLYLVLTQLHTCLPFSRPYPTHLPFFLTSLSYASAFLSHVPIPHTCLPLHLPAVLTPLLSLIPACLF